MSVQPAVHPTDETLRAYGNGRLDDTVSDTVVRHLEGCETCLQRVADLSGDSFAGRLRAAGAPSRPAAGVAGKSPVGAGPVDEPVPAELAAHPQYQDVRPLGKGGMGVVYLATNKLMGRPEVLKVVGKDLLSRPGARERFLREIQAAAKLHHSNIVAAYSVLQAGDLLGFAMEYVPGRNLADEVRSVGPLPVTTACQYAVQVAQGLQHAHEHGLVHRDIKPGNLMLRRDGQRAVVKVLDFGLAKAVHNAGGPVDGELTGENRMMGTPDYIAPEQILDAAKADIRADVYSLGCTLYYLLTGRPPFTGTTLYALLHAHQTADAAMLNLVRPDVPPDLAAVVAKMLAKQQGKRHQTPGEVARALVPFTKSGARPAPPPEASQAPRVAPPPSNPTQAKVATARPKSTAVAPRSAEPAVASHAGDVWGTLGDAAPAAAEPQRARRPAPPRRPRWVVPAVAAGAVFLALAGAFGVAVFKAKTANGTIVVENVPDGAEVVVDGERVTVTKSGDAVTVSAVKEGSHRLRVVRDGKELLAKDDVVVTVGGEPVRVRVVPHPKPMSPDPPKPQQGDGFVPLFNGKDKTGWVVPAGMPDPWTVADGVLVGRGPGEDSYLHTVAKYANFHLRAEFRVNAEGNSGVFLWGVSRRGHDLRGYEVEIHYPRPADRNTLASTGSLIASAKPVALADARVGRAGDWCTLEVIVVGNVFTVKVNGVTTSSYVDPDRIDTHGWIGIQKYGPPTVIEFRKIEVKELPATTAADGFVPLFNDKDFTGWTGPDPARLKWSNDGGVISLRTTSDQRGAGTAISTAKADYHAYTLRGEVMVDKDRLGLIDVRHTGVDKPGETRVVCVALSAKEGPGTVYTSIPGRGPVVSLAAGERTAGLTNGEWCGFEAVVREDSLTTTINGDAATTLRCPLAKGEPGPIVIGCPAGGGCRFRNLRVKESPETTERFVPLFNGKDLTGWKPHPDWPGKWTVANGVLTGRAEAGPAGRGTTSFLRTVRSNYTDFHLRTEARINQRGGGGIFFRVDPGGELWPSPQNRWIKGYKVDIEAKNGDPTWTGGLMSGNYILSPPSGPTARAGDWFEMDLIVQSWQITVKVNGNVVNSYQDRSRRSTVGFISLEAYNASSRVEFRRIELKDLSRSSAKK